MANGENIKLKTRKIAWLTNFLCSEKHGTLNLENTEMVFYLFSEAVLKNSFEKYEPNKPYVFFSKY